MLSLPNLGLVYVQVSSPRLWWSGTCNRKICIPQKCIWMSHSSQEAKRRLSERHSVHMEVWKDRGHVLPNSRLRRLRSRQWQLSDTSKVGLRNLAGILSNDVKQNDSCAFSARRKIFITKETRGGADHFNNDSIYIIICGERYILYSISSIVCLERSDSLI